MKRMLRWLALLMFVVVTGGMLIGDAAALRTGHAAENGAGLARRREQR